MLRSHGEEGGRALRGPHLLELGPLPGDGGVAQHEIHHLDDVVVLQRPLVGALDAQAEVLLEGDVEHQNVARGALQLEERRGDAGRRARREGGMGPAGEGKEGGGAGMWEAERGGGVRPGGTAAHLRPAPDLGEARAGVGDLARDIPLVAVREDVVELRLELLIQVALGGGKGTPGWAGVSRRHTQRRRVRLASGSRRSRVGAIRF